jgi:hypothetical protein
VPVAADGRQGALHRHGDAAAPERPEALVAHAEAHRRRRLLLLLLLAAVDVRGREREHPAPPRRRAARGGRPRAAERQRRRGRGGERRRPRGGGGAGGRGARRGRPGRPPVQDHLGQDGAEDAGVIMLGQLLVLAGGDRGGGGLPLLPGGVVGRRRRRERRLQGGRGDGVVVVLGRARLRLPQEGHGARRGDAVVHPQGRRRRGALPGEQPGEHLALPLLRLGSRSRLLLVLAGDGWGCHGGWSEVMRAGIGREEERTARSGLRTYRRTLRVCSKCFYAPPETDHRGCYCSSILLLYRAICLVL